MKQPLRMIRSSGGADSTSSSSSKLRRVPYRLMPIIFSFLTGTYAGIQISPMTCSVGSPVENQFCDECPSDECDIVKKIPGHQQPGMQERMRRFSADVSSVAFGAASVSRDDFLSTFDQGFPVSAGSEQKGSADAKEVLMLYLTNATIPQGKDGVDAAFSSTDYGRNRELPSLSVDSAVSNCDNVLVVHLRNPFSEGRGELPNQCVALVSGYGSPNIYRWARNANQNGGENKDNPPFSPAGIRGRFMDVIDGKNSARHRSRTLRYLETLDEALDELRPIVERIAKRSKRAEDKNGKGTVVVMAANKGFATLISNFCCASLANGIDLSNVLVFATDDASYKNAISLGFSAFRTEKYIGSLPKEAAEAQSDSTFNIMTLAKIISVHMVNLLGHDVLFQDADVVWFRDPLDYFLRDGLSSSYDIMFMDDGNPLGIFAPYRANTGFYFVRSNKRTRYLYQNLIFAADQIVERNDQIAMAAMLNVHTGLHGLRAKTLDWHFFPGGREWNREPSFVENIVLDGKSLESGALGDNNRPYTFHMHWTHNIDDKLKYMRQSAMWFLRDECLDKFPADGDVQVGSEGNEKGEVNSTHAAVSSLCCSPTPLISCHYANKPRVAACRRKG